MERLIINFCKLETEQQVARATSAVWKYINDLGRDGHRITANFDTDNILCVWHDKFQEPGMYTWGDDV